jgi:hypothetical protein
MAEVSVIAHYEEMPWGDCQGLHVVPRIHVARIDLIMTEVGVRVRYCLAVQDDLLVMNFYRIARDAHHPLDEIFGPILGVDEHNHISPSRLNYLRPSLVCERNANAIKELVYQDMVADKKSGFH